MEKIFSFHGRFFLTMEKIFSYHGRLFSFHGENFFFPWKIFSFHGENFFFPWKIFSYHGGFFLTKTISLTPTIWLISGSPSGGRTGAWGLAVSWGWSHCTSPKKQPARKRGGRGDCACWLGAFLGWSHCTSTRKHPASMRSKQGVKQGSSKKSNINQARNASEEAPKSVIWEPQRGADGSWLDDRG